MLYDRNWYMCACICGMVVRVLAAGACMHGWGDCCTMAMICLCKEGIRGSGEVEEGAPGRLLTMTRGGVSGVLIWQENLLFACNKIEGASPLCCYIHSQWDTPGGL